MNPEIKAKWIAALRSGEYKQTQGVLRDRKGYCCLGVLCKIYADERGMRWDNRKLSVDDPGDPCGKVPSAQICEWAGLPMPNPKIDGGTTLAEENDEGKTFAEIADIIEREL